ncbi:putative bifunctional diguanylate cyclase/phosphodiesterase [Comamonas flocculans]|uniref:EAL domain-containing protein n=1 Tax=Comamonas flocculans TaxID=2597701 RepID=A0A5B8RWP9_9BURK|nr:EAL domain-containing protein [Comamonas flocculans]QEA13092.1 EAL domain-containing protein [Comamonas flocculans]
MPWPHLGAGAAPAGRAPLPARAPRRWPGRLLVRWTIGTRLLALMALAATIGITLTASGLRGMADTAAELQRVHDERMVPVRTLSQIAQLMLHNQYQLQLVLARASIASDARSHQPALDAAAARSAAEAIAGNARQITALWEGYAAVLAPDGAEHAAARAFALERDAYLREGIAPALKALNDLDAAQASERAQAARRLYTQAQSRLQTLVALQFSHAQAAYELGMQRYRRTRNCALLALPVAIVLLGLLGWGQIRAITAPLRVARSVFKRIARGQFNTPIDISGRDEISALLRDLSGLQARLADNERELDHLVHYDQLTGLPNRRLLRERIAQALNPRAHASGQRALLLLDLDHFKTINDTMGHEVGDRYLQEMARRLDSVAQPRHFVARIGGDEFVVLSGPLGSDAGAALAQARELAQELLQRLGAPWQAREQVHHGSASMGMYLFGPGQGDTTELLKRADLAMYQAKAQGRNQWCLFDPQMQIQLEHHAALTAALRDAVRLEQLALHLQPQMNAAGQLVGAEALLRWRHPVHGQVAPDLFIALAEAAGTIVPIGNWVLQQACLQLQAWSRQPELRGLKLSVNVSARQFKQADFSARVLRLMQRHGLDASRLVLELTESMLIDDIDDTVAKMRALHRHGVRFALDDFGTGYSSLSLLRELPLQVLKIDRSFVRDVAGDEGSATLVRAIVALAGSLGLQTIAEGVETSAQQAALLAQGCHGYQGYLFARPMPALRFLRWARLRARRAAAAPDSSTAA